MLRFVSAIDLSGASDSAFEHQTWSLFVSADIRRR